MSDLYSIYPKQFRKSKLSIEKDRCFVLMPFDPVYLNLYESIKKELSLLNIKCFRDDEITGTQPFMNKVLTEILKSRFIIVILTDYRPNVLYELGIAHCFKDVQNVMLLIEKDSKFKSSVHETASDLSHLSYVEYDKGNISIICDEVRKFINKGKSSSDFQEFLFDKGILQYISENNNDYLCYIEEKLNTLFPAFTDMLVKNDTDVITQKIIAEQCRELLYEQIEQSGEYIDLILKIYAEILIASNDKVNSSNMIKDFISDEMIRVPVIPDNVKISLKTDLIIYLAEREQYLNEVLPWVINYFRRTKSSAIDLNRYKLESFLLSSENYRVKDAMCNALREPHFHIREHLSDVIGEKGLRQAYNILCVQLKQEPSLYAGKSMIVALGKIGSGKDSDASTIILQWLTANLKNIVASGKDFTNSILTKSRKAINNLDSTQLEKFDDKFSKYITDKEY